MAFLDFYIQATGSDLNAGTDNTATPTAIPSATCVVSSGTITFTGASGAFTGVSVGNWVSLYNSADTVSRFTGQVATNDNTIITILYASGTGYSTTGLGLATGLTTGGAAGAVICRVGGPWASFAITNAGGAMNGTTPSLSGALTANDGLRVNVLAGTTYAISTTSITLPVGLINKPILWRGYYAAIGDIDNYANVSGTFVSPSGATLAGASRPLITTISSTQFILSNYTHLWNLEFTGPGIGTASTQAAVVFSGTGDIKALRCRFTSTSRSVIASTSTGTCTFEACYVTGSSGGAAMQLAGYANVNACTFRNGSLNLFTTTANVTFCIFDLGTGSNTLFISHQLANGALNVSNCTFYGGGTLGQDGIWLRYNPVSGRIANNLFVSLSGYGVNGNGVTHNVMLINNAFVNCSSGNTNSIQPTAIIGSITEISAPFANAISHDFTLATGAASRQAGMPGQFEV